MSVDSGSGPTFHPPPAPLSGTVVCGVGALHASAQGHAGFRFVSRFGTRVCGGLSSFEGRPAPPTWRRRVRTFSPTPCVGSPGRAPVSVVPAAETTWPPAVAAGSGPGPGASRGALCDAHISDQRALCIRVFWHVCSELSISQVTSHNSHHRPCPMSPPPEASSARRGSGCDILSAMSDVPST